MTHAIRILMFALLLISGVLSISPVHAAPAAAQVCMSCHGTQGQGNGVFPRIAGQPAGYLQQQLRLFRSGQRVNSIMQPIAANLSDSDIKTVAAYFSGLTPPSAFSSAAISAAQRVRGQQLVPLGDSQQGAPACIRCHAPDLRGVAPEMPALAGQSPQYMAARLTAYQSGNNQSPLSVRVMAHVSRNLSPADIQAVTAYIAQLKFGEQLAAVRPPHDKTYKFTAQPPGNFVPPPESAIPTGPDGDMIWRGLLIFENTQHYAHQYVGNALNCSNCHLSQGRRAGSAPMWAAYVAYPKYRSKNHKVNTIEERIQGCFRFSMNGTPPAADSPEMKALVTYFHWLATGLPVGITPKGAGYPKLSAPPQPVNIQRGASVYAVNCAMCHGDDGNGRASGAAEVFPPLWGSRSFNWGAGMQGISTAADFIKANMPFGAGQTLTDQQAWDVAAFVVSHERPQDPRFTGNVEETRKKYHARNSYYGQVVNGVLLGAPVKPHK